MNSSLAKDTITTILNISYKKSDTEKELSIDLPKITYEEQKNVLFIKGNSIGKEINKLYEDVLDTIQIHFQHSEKLSLYLYINKLNTPTLKYFFDIFKELKEQQSNDKQVQVTWFFDLNNASMMNSAFDFSDLFDLKVTVIAV